MLSVNYFKSNYQKFMKRGTTISKITLGTGALAMSVGLISTLDVSAQTSGSGSAGKHACVTVQTNPQNKDVTCVGEGTMCSSVSEC